jgi:hypothetical protein
VVAILKKVRQRVANIIRRLSSNSDGEVVAAVHALRSTIDLHDLAEHIESPSLTKEEMSKLFEAGRAQGIEDMERRQNEEINSHADVDMEWPDAARLLLRYRIRFGSNRDRQFIEGMAQKADEDEHDELSPAQRRYLYNLLAQLRAQVKAQKPRFKGTAI